MSDFGQTNEGQGDGGGDGIWGYVGGALEGVEKLVDAGDEYLEHSMQSLIASNANPMIYNSLTPEEIEKSGVPTKVFGAGVAPGLGIAANLYGAYEEYSENGMDKKVLDDLGGAGKSAVALSNQLGVTDKISKAMSTAEDAVPAPVLAAAEDGAGVTEELVEDEAPEILTLGEDGAGIIEEGADLVPGLGNVLYGAGALYDAGALVYDGCQASQGDEKNKEFYEERMWDDAGGFVKNALGIIPGMNDVVAAADLGTSLLSLGAQGIVGQEAGEFSVSSQLGGLFEHTFGEDSLGGAAGAYQEQMVDQYWGEGSTAGKVAALSTDVAMAPISMTVGAVLEAGHDLASIGSAIANPSGGLLGMIEGTSSETPTTAPPTAPTLDTSSPAAMYAN